MFQMYFRPLDDSFDDGFYATGDAFRTAAERLLADDKPKIEFNAHLPINYLLRHSVELFLKSMVITVHRALKLSSGEDAHTPEPKLKVESKWKWITTVHSVKALMAEFDRLVLVNAQELAERGAGNWKSPEELAHWIDVIEADDSRSTFWRYPVSNSPSDAFKSSFKQTDLDTIEAEIRKAVDGDHHRVALVVDDNDVVVKAFHLDRNPLPDSREALLDASRLLCGSAYGIQMELVYGCGRRTAPQK